MVDYVQDKLKLFGARATFFCTGGCVPYEIRSPNEVGIHPNPDINWRDDVKFCREILYPEARGLRSHRLYQSSSELSWVREFGLEYESNTLMFLIPNLRMWTRPDGLVSVPIYWEDDVYLAYRAGVTFDIYDLRLNTLGLKVLNFHPIHVYMNTETIEDYQKSKGGQFVSPHGHPGIGSLFEQVLRWWGTKCVTVGEAVDSHLGKNIRD